MNKHNSLGAGLAIDLFYTNTYSTSGRNLSVESACPIVAPLTVLQ